MYVSFPFIRGAALSSTQQQHSFVDKNNNERYFTLLTFVALQRVYSFRRENTSNIQRNLILFRPYTSNRL